MSEAPTTPEVAELILGGQRYELPVYVGSEGERAIDIGALRADPFKAYSRRAHVLFPADEPRNAPPKPWHIGDNPKEPQQ